MDPPDDPDRAAPPERPAAHVGDARRRTARPATGWAWELKWDGIRALGYVDGGRIRLLSRNGNDVTRRYPELRRLGEALGTREVVLDGEIVAFDESGRPSFELLQRRMHVESESTIRRLVAEVPVTYVLFDMLWLDGHSTMDAAVRRTARAPARSSSSTARRGRRRRTRKATAPTTVEVSKRFGLEGVVAKRLDCRYEPGRRSPAWVKVKNHLRQEFVVGGWQPGEKGRTGSIGSLLVGYYDGDDLALRGQGRQRTVRDGHRRARAAVRRGRRAPTARSPAGASRRVCSFVEPRARRRGPLHRVDQLPATSATPPSWAPVPTRTRAMSRESVG